MARQNTKAVVRAPGGRFAPGQSGNPGGRPKALAEVKALAAEHTPDAIKALHDVAMNGEFEPARVAAAVALLDRAWGKPRQELEISGPEGGPMQIEAPQMQLGPDQMAELLHVLQSTGQLGGASEHEAGDE